MSDFSIAISGLDSAQKALTVVGNNLANAATEGYHLQRVDLRPALPLDSGGVVLGQGVEVATVRRMVDALVELELLRQRSLGEHLGSELSVLQTVENAFGELATDEGGLDAALDRFFNSLQDLSIHPADPVWQNQMIGDADSLAGRFRALDEFLTELETQIDLESQNVVDSINTIAVEIARLNDSIERFQIRGGAPNDLMDKRDQLLDQLAELVGLEITNRQRGSIDIITVGIPLVVGTSTVSLEVGLDASGKLGVTATGAATYLTQAEGGKLGALLSLRNDLIAGVHNDLNKLAGTIIRQINTCHAQGLGSAGSFTELVGSPVTSENLSDLSAVTSGKLYIRMTNTSTGAVSRHEISIDADSDTLSSLASKISSITGLTASVDGLKLRIFADSNYKFDFLPAVLPEPTGTDLNGSSPPDISVSGIYSGTTNQTFTFTVTGTGSVGNGTLKLSVTDGSGDPIATLNVGSGYAAGDWLELGNGIKVALGVGDLVAGDSFEVDAFASSDTSGVLAALGLNTLFSGSTASDMAVRSEIIAQPNRVATAIGPEMTDNKNILRMADLRSQPIADFGSLTCGEFYRRTVTNLGQTISVKQVRQNNIEMIVQNLLNQRAEISGVDINEQAAQLLVFQHVFQAMAKYMATIQTAVLSLMNVV